MNREVCGICWCPTGDCACPPASVQKSTQQPKALRLAAELEDGLCGDSAAELRRLHAELERCKATCAATSECWRADADRWAAQRDALLKVLKDVLPVAEDASESLGRFCGDEGWAQEDMDRMDNVDGMLPLMRAAIKAAENT